MIRTSKRSAYFLMSAICAGVLFPFAAAIAQPSYYPQGQIQIEPMRGGGWHQGGGVRTHLEWCATDYGAFEGIHLAQALIAQAGKSWLPVPSNRAQLMQLAVQTAPSDPDLAYGLVLSCQAHNTQVQALLMLRREQVMRWLNIRANGRW
ncbi:hypothetical protein [Paucibacter sp. DJ2R-2]|uniref:hypothetical protein n=1 Tax=Paucibacter sp. DJ2R-2 TaxID=2893558 RepID=UPI0021E39E67|nr:hypothetical protein [Paucibacter sp. DJ2R-2]MCV2441276.1 hypothetical protein [Paucibacter sp. DJ2R-2]